MASNRESKLLPKEKSTKLSMSAQMLLKKAKRTSYLGLDACTTLSVSHLEPLGFMLSTRPSRLEKLESLQLIRKQKPEMITRRSTKFCHSKKISTMTILML